MRSDDGARALDGLLRAHPDLPAWSGGDAPLIAGLTADSRAVAPGFLFAALLGAKADGRAFIAEAVSRGAAAVLAPAGTAWPDGVPARPLLHADDPRRAFALMASAFFGGAAAQPAMVAAVTGTNGKTSTVDFLRQLWTLDGAAAASIGTLGVIADGVAPGPSLTTPDPVALHAMLAALRRSNVGHVAMEASSHGLEQRRLDGVSLAAVGFTNLTRDHLDYHGSMEAYRSAKLRLFSAAAGTSGASAVLNADMDPDTLARTRALAARQGFRIVTVGEAGSDVRLLAQRPLPDGQALQFEAFGARHAVHLSLPGRFQADNALMALALAVATHRDAKRIVALLPRLAGVRGRMELAAQLPNGATVYVDYAHTPDALERLLGALRPHVAPGAKLHVLFGAGGDRDPGKRPLMGAAAARLADRCWITDDNPRGENPAAIRRAVLAGCPEGVDAGDRASAIARALSALRPGDVLAVAGKGHESGQTIGGVTHPFDDVSVVRGIAFSGGGGMTALWTAAELRAATGGMLAHEIAVRGISIDTRSIAEGDLFVALRDVRDGHDFVAEALAKGAAGAVVDHDPPGVAPDAPLLRVGDTLTALRALGAAGRARSSGRFVGVTGSVGKTTTKEMLRLALGALGLTHAAMASHNNHWGVPLTLARLPRDAAFGIVEMGMNNRGEIEPLSRLARPHVAVITTIGTSHIGNLGSQAAIAEEKADILLGLESGGTAILPAETSFLPRLLERARAAGARVLTFGESARADIQLTDYVADAARGTARLLMDGLPLSIHLNAPGQHLAMNACAAIAAVHALGGDVVAAAEALAGFKAGAGRGARVTLHLPGGDALLLDDSYNASPASIRAGLTVLMAQTATRRIVAFGDMLELGTDGAAMHAELAPDIAAAADLVYACGPLMRHLFDALPEGRRGAHLADSASLAPVLAAALRPRDAVLVKGSLGSRMATVVTALDSLNERAGNDSSGAGVVS